jgi:hypothetical protein
LCEFVDSACGLLEVVDIIALRVNEDREESGVLTARKASLCAGRKKFIKYCRHRRLYRFGGKIVVFIFLEVVIAYLARGSCRIPDILQAAPALV